MRTVARLVSARGRGASVRLAAAPPEDPPGVRRADGTRIGPVFLARDGEDRPPAPARRRVGPWPLGVRRSVISASRQPWAQAPAPGNLCLHERAPQTEPFPGR